MGKGEVEALRAALDQEIFCTLMQDGAGADNLAIAICSYFSDHPERPDLDPDDDEHGWGEWVMQQYESLRERLLDSAMKRVTARIDTLAAENAALREGMNGDYDLDAWLAWRKEKEELLEALRLADAALSGANMNMKAVERKVKAAVAKCGQEVHNGKG